MAYHDCKKCKDRIDEILEINAKMFTELGTDCSKTAYEKAKRQERVNLRSVRKYDPQKIDRLVRHTD